MTEIPVGEPLAITIQEPEGSLEALAEASGPEELKAVAGRWPECLAAWAALGDDAFERDEPVMAYAYFRVGYHRGLDRIRQSGWRGMGAVPWAHVPNRGFLTSLAGLGRAAGAIGEADEAERCRSFFAELAPDAPASGG